VLSTGARPSAAEAQACGNGSAGSSGVVSEAGSAAGRATGMSRLQRLNAAMRKRSAGAQVLLSEHMQALWHSYKPLTRPDRALLDRCEPLT
jgi:hypothetical protein